MTATIAGQGMGRHEVRSVQRAARHEDNKQLAPTPSDVAVKGVQVKGVAPQRGHHLEKAPPKGAYARLGTAEQATGLNVASPAKLPIAATAP